MLKKYMNLVFISFLFLTSFFNYFITAEKIVLKPSELQEKVEIIYNKIKLIESEGDNITSLVNKLNEVNIILTNIYVLLEKNEYDNIYNSVLEGIHICDDLDINCNMMYEDIILKNYMKNYSLFLRIRLLNIFIIIACIVSWGIFKYYYVKKLLKKQPLVMDIES
jgi:hypothetical protein